MSEQKYDDKMRKKNENIAPKKPPTAKDFITENDNDNIDTKLQFLINGKTPKKQRQMKHDKRRSMKKKSKVNYEKRCIEYDNFMLSNQVKKKKHRESPHIVIHRSLRYIEEHTIFFKKCSD